MSPEVLYKHRMFELWQQTIMEGFTAAQLEETGCWNKPDAKPSDLAGYMPVHGIFREMNWEPKGQATVMVEEGQRGRYAYENPVIKEALEPVLALASCLIVRMELGEWYVLFLYDVEVEKLLKET